MLPVIIRIIYKIVQPSVMFSPDIYRKCLEYFVQVCSTERLYSVAEGFMQTLLMKKILISGKRKRKIEVEAGRFTTSW
eukprot:g31746.t1